MDKNLSEIVCIVDRSGSMATIAADAIGGFNTFLAEQKKLPGEAQFTLVLFDTEYLVPVANQPIQSVEPLTNKTFVPRGGTALLDAIGRTIATIGVRLGKTPESERPAHVIVVILTDGEENSSHEYSHSRIASMIQHQQDKYNWHFVYLGVGIDAFAASRSFNMASTHTYLDANGVMATLNMADVSAHTGVGISGMYGSLGGTVAVLRGLTPNVTINNFPFDADKQAK